MGSGDFCPHFRIQNNKNTWVPDFDTSLLNRRIYGTFGSERLISLLWTLNGALALIESIAIEKMFKNCERRLLSKYRSNPPLLSILSCKDWAVSESRFLVSDSEMLKCV